MLNKFKQLSMFKKVLIILFGIQLVVGIVAPSNDDDHQYACWCADAMNLPMYVKGQDMWKLDLCNDKYVSSLAATMQCEGIQ